MTPADVLDILRQRGGPLRRIDILHAAGLPVQSGPAVQSALDALFREGRVRKMPRPQGSYQCVTPEQAREAVLATLRQTGVAMTVTQIASQSGISQQAVGVALSPLADAGLVRQYRERVTTFFKALEATSGMAAPRRPEPGQGDWKSDMRKLLDLTEASTKLGVR